MREGTRTARVSQLFCGYEDIEYLIRTLTRVIVPVLEEEDSLWELTNRVCDRYMCPMAA